MTVTIWELLAFVTAMNILLLLAVFIGGWLVFRVRERGEPMFLKRDKEDVGAFTLGDEEAEEVMEPPEELVKRSKKVIDQLFKEKDADYDLSK